MNKIAGRLKNLDFSDPFCYHLQRPAPKLGLMETSQCGGRVSPVSSSFSRSPTYKIGADDEVGSSFVRDGY